MMNRTDRNSELVSDLFEGSDSFGVDRSHLTDGGIRQFRSPRGLTASNGAEDVAHMRGVLAGRDPLKVLDPVVGSDSVTVVAERSHGIVKGECLQDETVYWNLLHSPGVREVDYKVSVSASDESEVDSIPPHVAYVGHFVKPLVATYWTPVLGHRFSPVNPQVKKDAASPLERPDLFGSYPSRSRNYTSSALRSEL